MLVILKQLGEYFKASKATGSPSEMFQANYKLIAGALKGPLIPHSSPPPPLLQSSSHNKRLLKKLLSSSSPRQTEETWATKAVLLLVTPTWLAMEVAHEQHTLGFPRDFHFSCHANKTKSELFPFIHSLETKSLSKTHRPSNQSWGR